MTYHCPHCGKDVVLEAKTSHLRQHVRAGQLVELKPAYRKEDEGLVYVRNNHIIFLMIC